jgi:predicted nucleic acid-binding protein
MKYLLDASALLPLTTKRGKQLITDATKQTLLTTDLAIYETCNTLWKLATLLKTITQQDATKTITLIEEITAKNLIQPTSYQELDLQSTLQKAHSERITFYVASYITAAEQTEATLVTEDEKLQKASTKSVKTISYTELEHLLDTRQQ